MRPANPPFTLTVSQLSMNEAHDRATSPLSEPASFSGIGRTRQTRRRSTRGRWLALVLGAACGLPLDAALAQQTTAPPAATPAYTRQRPRDDAGYVTGPARVNWWNDAVFYQVFVRSFQDSRDGPLAGDGIGDLRGLISRLDYLNDGDPASHSDLGVTGLWLMPVHPSPSYHGYDITDYTAVNPQYGTLDDFRELVRACHARGIRVVLDLVLNHTSSRHPWFASSLAPASPKRDWYLWRHDDPGYRGPWNQRVWHSLTGRRAHIPGGPDAADSGYFYGLFGADMPDLNFSNPEVADEMLRVVRFWLDASPGGPAADGFRLDAIRHLIEHGEQQDNTHQTHRWLEEFFPAYKASNPDAVAIGEVWASTEVAASYVGGQMDMTFEFDLARALVDAARTGRAAPVHDAMRQTRRAFPPNQYGTFLTNHDQERIASTLASDPGKLRVAAALLLTGPGVPFIYYAEEVGQTGVKPDPDLRTPMPWTVEGSAFSTARPWRARFPAPAGTSVEEQTNDPESLLSLYRRLIRLRGSVPALAHGDLFAVTCDRPEVYASLRYAAGERGGPASAALVLINLSDQALDGATLSFGPEFLVAARSLTDAHGRFAARCVLGSSEALRATVLEEGGARSGRVHAGGLPPFDIRVFELHTPAP